MIGIGRTQQNKVVRDTIDSELTSPSTSRITNKITRRGKVMRGGRTSEDKMM